MTQIREAIYNMVIGAPGYGKTTWLVKRIKKSPRKNVLLYKNDLGIDDAAVSDFKRLPKGQVYKGGWSKISDLDLDYKVLLQWILDGNFKNGALIVDDAGFYEEHNITEEFKQLLRMRRHIGLDIYYVYHGLTDAPIQHFPFLSNMVLFHTTDNPGYKANKLPRAKNGLDFNTARDRLMKLVEAGHPYQPIVLNFA